MRCVGSFGVGLCLLLTGCVSIEDGTALVANPFGQSPEVQQVQAYSSPASKEAATRVLCVGDKILKANPEMGLRPLIATIAAPQVEICHRGQKEIYVTEGFIKQCVSDGQLAAALCTEMGKMVAERKAQTLPETRQPERGPSLDVPVGNDSGGVFGAADGTRRVELAKFESQRVPRGVSVPPPSANILARRYLQQTGYALEDLDAAAPLLRQSDMSGTWRKQLVGNSY